MCISDDVLLVRTLKYFSDIKMESTNMQRNRLSNVSLESNSIKHPLYPTLKSPLLQPGNDFMHTTLKRRGKET